MRELFTIVRAVFDLALTKGTDAARTLALIKRPNFNATRGEMYLRALWRLTLAFLLVPIPLMVFGFIGGAFGKVAAPIAAILWSMITIALAIVASPLGIVVDFLKGGVQGLGERYVRFVGNVLFIEYSIAFLVSTIPLRNNPGGVPLLLIILTLLVLAGVFTKRWVVKMAVAALPLLLLSFYSPPIFRAVNNLMASFEGRAATAIEEAADIRVGKSLRGAPSRVPQRTLRPGQSASVLIGTEYKPIDVVGLGVPYHSQISYHPEKDGDFIIIRHRGKEHTKVGPDGTFDVPLEPLRFGDSEEVKGNRPQTMTIAVW